MLVENWYAAVDAAGWIAQFENAMEDDGGPNPLVIGPYQYRLMVTPPSALPPQPTPTSQMKWIDGAPAWVEGATMAQLRDAKRIEINEAHELANKTSFTFMGKEIQANAHSMNQIQITNGGVLLRGALHPNWQGAWKTLDNEYVLIPDVVTWKAFYDAIETTGQSNFAKAQALKAQLASATTLEQVAAITWSAT